MKPALLAGVLVAATAIVPAALASLLREAPVAADVGGHACDGARPPARDKPIDPYAETVRCGFIETGLLVGRAEDEQGYPVVHLGVPPTPSALAFLENSRLLEDLVADDPAIWQFDGARLVGIEPFRHRERLPSAQTRAWSQSLLYRAGSVPGGTQAAEPITLLPTEPGLPMVQLPFTLEPESNESVRLYEPLSRARDVSSPHVDLPCPGEEPAGRILRVGTDILVRAGAVGEGKCTLTVGRANLSEPYSVARLAAGETVAIRHGDGRSGYALLRDRPASAPRALNWQTSSGRRQSDPASGAFGAAAGDQIARWMATGSGPAGARAADLELSLDAALQRFAQRRLEQFVASPEGRPRGGAPENVSAVVIDAFTGEALAIAGVSARDGPEDQPLRPSPALDLHPIGSAMKPLVAAAIIAEQPRFASLCVRVARPGPDTGSILGRRLQRPINAAPADIDFATFIRTSNNAYLPAMVLLASATGRGEVPLGDGEAWGYGSCSIAAGRPASVWDNRLDPADDRANGRSAPPAWVPRLAAIFSLNPAPRNAPDQLAQDSGWNARFAGDCQAAQTSPAPREPAFGSATIDAGPWRLLGKGSGAGAGWCGLDDIASPRREALTLSGRRSFEAEIMQAILGNGEGQLSTVKLAEAYARLVTGRRIEASFLAVEAPLRPAAALDPVYPPAAQAQVRTALASVVSAGTGTRAAPPLEAAREALAARGYALERFGKTGTPTLVRLSFSQEDRALNGLVYRRCLSWTGSGAAIDATRPECTARSSPALARRIRELNAVGADSGNRRRGAGWSVRNKVLIGVSPDQQKERYRVYGGVFALVVEVWPSQGSVRPARPVKACSIAVKISHGVEDGSAKAAELAGEIAARLLLDRQAALPPRPGPPSVAAA
jgi:hypothetical protein